MKKEEHIQIAVCTFLKYQYPDLIWCCDLSAGMKLTIGQAVKAKKMRSNRGLPDIMIFCPTSKYAGLFLELKTQSPYLKDGMTLKSDEHLQEQAAIHQKLIDKGYYACFVSGVDEAIMAIKNYMKN